MKGPTLTVVVLFFVAPIWSVAMWAMLMMTVGALKDERFILFRLFTGYFVQEPYNRKYLRIFVACVAALVAGVVIFNALYIGGFIEP